MKAACIKRGEAITRTCDRGAASSLAVLCVSHALVDAACAALVFSARKGLDADPGFFALLLLLYNVLAFALQAPLGFAADSLGKPAATAAGGCLLTALSLLLTPSPLAAVCLAGVGNALFHIGGGMTALSFKPGKAAMPGIFVSTGALGLLAGALAGMAGLPPLWLFAAGLVLCAFSITRISRPIINCPDKPATLGGSFGLCLLLILAAVASRSMLGLILNFPWKTDRNLLLLLTVAVVLGKGFGGVLADRFGWTRVAAGGLLLSVPFILAGFTHPVPAFLGMFLFNLAMPVTLAATAVMFPGRPGFAFGLTALAIISGAFPAFANLGPVLYNEAVVAAIILSTAAALFAGLRIIKGSRRSDLDVDSKKTSA